MTSSIRILTHIGILVFLVSSCSGGKFAYDSKYKWEFLGEFRETVIQNSIYIDSVDHNEMEIWAINEATSCKTTMDYFWVARNALFKLGDQHSYLATPTEIWEGDRDDEIKTFPLNVDFTSNQKNENIPYLNLKGMFSETNEDCYKYIDSLNALIKSMDSKSVDGWIIDLREHEGGDFSSLYLGMAPFVGEDTNIYLLNNSGKEEAIYLTNGFIGFDTSLSLVPVNYYELLDPLKPVAVLIGPNTASAGELLVLALKCHNNVRLFGSETNGLTTGMSMFQFKNGAVVNLATSVYLDCNGAKYGGKISPDYRIRFKQSDIGTEKDLVLIEAVRWIEGSSIK